MSLSVRNKGTMWRLACCVLGFLLLLTACSKKEGKSPAAHIVAPDEREVEEILEPYLTGDFEKCTEKVFSIRQLPENRQKDYVTMMRQHEAERMEENGAIDSYKLQRVDFVDSSKTATAVVEIVYSQGDTVVVPFPLEWHEGKWWMQ